MKNKKEEHGSAAPAGALARERLPYLLSLPSLLIVFGVLILPILYSLFLSVHDLILSSRTYEFVGLKHYIAMFHDDSFINSIKMTLLFTVLSVAAEMIIGIAVALVLNQEFVGRGFVRGLMILPWALPGVVNAIMWQWIFNSNYGVFNGLLTQLGIIDRYQVWLAKPTSAFLCVLVANVWKETPYVVLLAIAALANIPKELYEAAAIDGASAWKSFWKITLPLIKSVVLILLITKTIWALQTFDLVYIMTKGGPMGVTEFIAFYIQKTSFKFLKFGYGSAMSYTVSMICFALTMVYIKCFMGQDEDGGKKQRRIRRKERYVL
jgi:multiple sugar transport system permease protein